MKYFILTFMQFFMKVIYNRVLTPRSQGLVGTGQHEGGEVDSGYICHSPSLALLCAVPPQLRSVEKLSFTKLVPSARKFGNQCYRTL